MQINVMLDEGAKMPTKAHKTDAGFDLYTPNRVVIHKNDSVCIDTGVHIEIPEGFVGMIKSKSGLNMCESITSEGVIDSGYTGSIVVKVYNHSEKPVIFEMGQKFTQIVFIPIPDVELLKTGNMGLTERGANGFGSTGKF